MSLLPTEHFPIVKIGIVIILRDAIEHDFFNSNFGKGQHCKFHIFNELLIKWYGKFTSVNVYRMRETFF